jgi:hypothetical protein
MADVSAVRAVVHSMGFDQDMVQHALAQAGGNEQLAINLILNGEVHEAATDSTFAVSVTAPSSSVSVVGPTFGFATAFAPAEVGSSSSVASSSSMSPNVLSFPDHLIGRCVSLTFAADGKLLSPAQLRAQIMRPLELMQAAAWFFQRQSPGMKRHREEPPPPLGHMLTQFSPCVPVRVMCGCVATACRRLATAPAGLYVMYRTTGRWAAWIMERVTWGHVKKVQVWLQRRACCAVRCACRASACVRCVFDACCRKRWLVLRSVAAHLSCWIKRAAAFILVCRLLLPPALQADPTFSSRQKTETAFRCFAI